MAAVRRTSSPVRRTSPPARLTASLMCRISLPQEAISVGASGALAFVIVSIHSGAPAWKRRRCNGNGDGPLADPGWDHLGPWRPTA